MMDTNELIYNVLKEIQSGSVPTPENSGVANDQWLDTMTVINNKKYVQNMLILLYGPRNPYMVWLDWATLTPEGEFFLKKHASKY